MSDKIPKPINLNLSTDTSPGKQDHSQDQQASGGPEFDPGGGYAQPQAMPRESRPIMGWIAAIFGILGILVNGVVFVPLGLVCSIIALFMGQGMWAFIGIALNLIGLATSPVLLGILGLGALAAYFDISL